MPDGGPQHRPVALQRVSGSFRWIALGPTHERMWYGAGEKTPEVLMMVVDAVRAGIQV